MPTYKNESAAWRSLVKPLIIALCTFLAAGGAYLKAHTENNQNHDAAIERMVRLEAKVENDGFRLMKLERDSELLKSTLSEMNSSLSYIKGKMEAADSRQRRR